MVCHSQETDHTSCLIHVHCKHFIENEHHTELQSNKNGLLRSTFDRLTGDRYRLHLQQVIIKYKKKTCNQWTEDTAKFSQYHSVTKCQYMGCARLCAAINPLTPNDPYRGRTAPLTSKRCILYIY
jgi:hypothetical protein